MHNLMRTFGTAFACALFCALVPAPARAADDVQLSEVAFRTLRTETIVYKEVETTLAELGQVVGPIVEQLEKLVKEKKVASAGSIVFVYQGVNGEADQKFKLQVGIAVVAGTEPQGEFKVRKLEPFKCATVLYGGPVMSVAKAYEKLFGNLGGRTPTGEIHSYYLHFEGRESPNNVELIAVGVGG